MAWHSPRSILMQNFLLSLNKISNICTYNTSSCKNSYAHWICLNKERKGRKKENHNHCTISYNSGHLIIGLQSASFRKWLVLRTKSWLSVKISASLLTYGNNRKMASNSFSAMSGIWVYFKDLSETFPLFFFLHWKSEIANIN